MADRKAPASAGAFYLDSVREKGRKARINQPRVSRSHRLHALLHSEQIGYNVLYMFQIRLWIMEAMMLRIFVEEAAALASITLFVGMVAVWAQLVTQF
jgi:hypothetical protein